MRQQYRSGYKNVKETMDKYAIKVRGRVLWESFKATGCGKYVDEYAKRLDLPTGTVLEVLNIGKEEIYIFEVNRTVKVEYNCTRQEVDNKGVGYYDRMFNKFKKA